MAERWEVVPVPVQFLIEEIRNDFQQAVDKRILIEFRGGIQNVIVAFECFVALLKFDKFFSQKNEVLLQFDDLT